VHLPSSFPFFQRDPELDGLSSLAGLLGIDGDVAAELDWENREVLVNVKGGRSKQRLCCFPSSTRPVCDSVGVPPALGWTGVTAPLWIIELGPRLVILGLGIGEYSGLPLLGCQNNGPNMSPPTELCPELWPEPGLEQWPDPTKLTSGYGFPAQKAELNTWSVPNALNDFLMDLTRNCWDHYRKHHEGGTWRFGTWWRNGLHFGEVEGVWLLRMFAIFFTSFKLILEHQASEIGKLLSDVQKTHISNAINHK